MATLNRIVGIPGAGKTQRLREHVQRWVEVDGIEPADIVCTSFTRAASQVLRGRIPIPTGNATTLHSLAYRALEAPLIAEADKDLVQQWNEATNGAYAIGKHSTEALEDAFLAEMPTGSKPLEMYSHWRATGRQNRFLEEITRDFAKRWEDFKAQTHSMDFQDLLDNALAYIDRCPGDPECFVVDEAQDLTPSQWALAQKWGAAARYRYVVAGDPAQCLFSWVGASPEHLLEPLPAGGQHVLLGHSHRCPQLVLSEAEGWLMKHSGSMSQGREVTSREEQGGVYHMPVTADDPEGLVGALLEHVDAGQSVAVLGTCSYVLNPVIAVLREFGVPFHNPYRLTEGRWNPLRAGTGSGQRLKLWLTPGQSGPRMVTALEKLPAKLFQGTRKAALDRIMGQGRVESLRGILVDEGASAWESRDGGWYCRAFSDAERRPYEFAWNVWRRNPEYLDSEPKVIVGTIHSVKGGEADHVYLLPDLPYRVVDEAHSDQKVMDACIRQWYVGITRARQAVYYCDPVKPSASIEAI